MSNFVARLEFEHEELVERLTKLNEFLETDKTCYMDKEAVDLLYEQVVIMRQYRDVLEKRLNLIYAEANDEPQKD